MKTKSNSQQAIRQNQVNTMSDTSVEDNKLLEVGCDRDLSSPVDIYIRLNDVVGLFKNRKKFKIRKEKRTRITEVIKKLPMYSKIRLDIPNSQTNPSEDDESRCSVYADKNDNTANEESDTARITKAERNLLEDYGSLKEQRHEYSGSSNLLPNEEEANEILQSLSNNSNFSFTFDKKIVEIKKEIERCNEYKLLKIRCDVLNEKGKPCKEIVTPMIDFDARATSDNKYQWEYQRSYHTGFSCPKHGCVPISINGRPVAENKPEEVFGEFKEVLQATLSAWVEAKKIHEDEIKLWKDKYYTGQKVFCEHNDRIKERHEDEIKFWKFADAEYQKELKEASAMLNRRQEYIEELKQNFREFVQKLKEELPPRCEDIGGKYYNQIDIINALAKEYGEGK